jgi:hypothetical protein
LGKTIPLHQAYQTEVTGLGEVYEVLSCRLLMQRLRRRYPGHFVITFLSRREVESETLPNLLGRSAVVASGFVDIPPWRSGYRPLKMQSSGVSPLLRFLSFVKPLLGLLACLERWYPYSVKARKAHVVWFLQSSGLDKRVQASQATVV